MVGILKSLRNGAPRHDEMNAMSLKMVSSFIIETLTHIFNLSLTQRVLPDELKLANVLPLYKEYDPYIFDNYRPALLLNVLPKVFEKVMYNRWIEFLEMYRTLVNQQFHFRKLHSSCTALMILTEKLITAIDNNDTVVGIFFLRTLIPLIMTYN